MMKKNNNKKNKNKNNNKILFLWEGTSALQFFIYFCYDFGAFGMKYRTKIKNKKKYRKN